MNKMPACIGIFSTPFINMPSLLAVASLPPR